MMLYVPDYYSSFRCIADRCRHSCCIGWEIDIDDETLDRYRNVSGAIGERLSANIVECEEGASFRLDADERCPFLNKNGLCDLISSLGEGFLCEICAEHPRFRNFYHSRTELGLGLCCEAAAALILTHQSKMTLVRMGDESEIEPSVPSSESELFAFRERVFAILQNRTLSFAERLRQMLTFVGIAPEPILDNDGYWTAIFLNLERLDPKWSDRLELWHSKGTPTATLQETPELTLALEQLAVYFVYRHLPDSLNDGRSAERIAFAALSCQVITALTALEAAKQGSDPLPALLDIARSYSAEIEYSTENVEVLLDELEKL